MSRIAKFLTGGFLFVAGIIALFIIGLRSCLSQFDERSALPPAVFAEKDGKSVLLSLIQYSKVTSYSQSGGMTRKTVSDEYYLQTNDVVTGKKMLLKEIDLPSRPKNFPMEILGVADDQVWLFVNELLVYNAFTLEKIAGVETIQEKNRSLKDKMPKEKSYYQFDQENKKIKFTATDGSRWWLDAKTLLVTSAEGETKKATPDWNDIQSKIEQLHKMNVHFSQIKINQDTSNGKWSGIYAPEEFIALNDRIEINALNGQDQRRQFITASYDSVKDYRKFVVNKSVANTVSGAGYFLDGGFLTDKKSAAPIHLKAPEGFLIVYKEQIGNDGKIMISRITTDGKITWKYNTQLPQWNDWQMHGDRLYIFGNNNRKITSSQSNLLIIIGLTDGAVNVYDYSK